jgi:hypothetical protein
LRDSPRGISSLRTGSSTSCSSWWHKKHTLGISSHSNQFLQSYQLWRPLFATRDWCRISRIPEQSVCWRHLFRCQCGGVSCRRRGGLANGACLSWIALAEEEAYVDRPGGVCVLYACGV